MNSSLPHEDSIAIEQICTKFAAKLGSAEEPLIEDFIDSLNSKARNVLLSRMLLIEWRYRKARGQSPDVSEYVSRFPNETEIVRRALMATEFNPPRDESKLINSQHLREAWKTSELADELSPDDQEPIDATIVGQIGRYRILRILGEGGFGRVYLAEDPDLKRSVAIKVPSRSLGFGREFMDQYRIEAQILAKLDHSNIVPVYDVGSTDEHPCFIVSKLIEGHDLSQELSQRQLSIQESAHLIATVAEALNYAHSKKVIHRDIKPGNILLDAEGTPYVVDFGVALHDQHYGKQTGLVGTIAYMSPEQARGEGHLVDGRSDVFSLGIVFYRLLTNELPFTGSDRAEVLERIARLEPRPPRQINGSVPKEIERICLKALAKLASDRYATCGDLADDLHVWHKSVVDQSTQDYKSGLRLSTPSSPVSEYMGVVPKGLRCFDRQDADFFLNLVPGPRDRDGLPDCLRQWKAWVHQPMGDDLSRVGLIYGPSGCGKSSLVRAGLMPILDRSIERIVIEASPQQTEERLLRRLRDRFTDVPKDLSLSQTMAELRRSRGSTNGAKPLIVLDQFEQWLHTHSEYESTELLLALRQCDGIRIQCIILVRDDFFLALSRFMSLLEVPLVQGKNMMMVDLFDPPHANKVLTMFGRAYDRIPPLPTELTRDNAQFIAKSIESLESDGKVFPVRLALFADMVKSRPWTPATVAGLGGAEGIGTIFLEEAFSTQHAPANQKIHERAARSVLETLLPEPGMQMKGRRQTRDELIMASGYTDRPTAFDALLQLLDFQLRLITPTDSTDGSTGDETDPNAENYYQLSHDYLVPSVREWISRKQKQTFLGRLQLEFTDRAALFSSMPEKKLLPSWWEWLKFKTFLRRRDATDAGRQMMRSANRHFILRTLLTLAILAASALGLLGARRSLQATSLRNQLASAQVSELPAIIAKLGPYRRNVEPILRRTLQRSTVAHEKLVAALALVPWDHNMVNELCDQALQCQPNAMVVIVEALLPHAPSITDRFWKILQDQNESNGRRFRAAQVLAQIDPLDDDTNSARWKTQAAFIERELVATTTDNAQHFSTLASLLRPVSSVLIEPLTSHIEDADQNSAQARNKINLLTFMLSDSPVRLLDLTLNATPWQLQSVLEKIGKLNSDGLVSTLRRAVAGRPTSDQSLKERERTARRVGTSAALLAKQGLADEVWPLLRRNPIPSTRSYLIHRFSQVGVPFETIANRLMIEEDTGIRAGLLMAVGEYEKPNERRWSGLISHLAEIFQNDPYPGVHGAAEWLLRKWKSIDVIEDLADQTSETATDYSNGKKWRIDSEGFTFVQIDARKDPNIGRIFEIATKEVSREQYQRLAPNDTYFHAGTSPTVDCPANVITWFEAVRYCRELSELEGFEPDEAFYPDQVQSDWSPDDTRFERQSYRLPTEAEWEFACRSNSTTRQYFGDSTELITKYAWCIENSNERAWPGGTLKPNEFGLFDMYGNLMEWCTDLERNATHRVIRGGTFRFPTDELMSTTRRTQQPDVDYNSIGFRIVRTVAD